MKSFIFKAIGKPLSLLLLAVLLSLLIDFSGISSRIDQVLIDAGIAMMPQKAPQAIAIVAVDEKSLRQYGRWPWSRQIYVKLLEQLSMAESGPVAFDVLFTDASKKDPAGDQAFAAAIAKHGKIVLAMISDEDPDDGEVSEVLPLPRLAEAAAGIGHTDMAIDGDGIVRGTYLLAGSGVARWPELSLVALYVSGKLGASNLPGNNFPDRNQGHEGHWVRDHKIVFPFAAEPGVFPMFSFVDVREGKIAVDELKNKTLIVGITAASIRRVFAVPGLIERTMSGVEIHANALNALQQGLLLNKVHGFPRLLGLVFFSVIATLILFYIPFNSMAARLVLALAATTGLSVDTALTAGLLLPITPVWLSLSVVSYLLARKRAGGLQQNATPDFLT